MADKLLDITTGADRPVINIDGKPFEMRHAGEFDLVELHRIQTFGKHFAEAFEGDDESLLEKLEQRRKGVLKSILPELSDDVFTRLSVVNTMKLLRVFMERSVTFAQNEGTGLSAEIQKAMKEEATPESSSQESSDSTADAPKTGSTTLQ